MDDPLQLERKVTTTEDLVVRLPYQEVVDAALALARAKGLDIPDGPWLLCLPWVTSAGEAHLILNRSDETVKTITTANGPLAPETGEPEPWTPPATKDEAKRW